MLLALAATAAQAADKLQFGPAPEWVKPAPPTVAAVSREGGAPTRSLLVDQQIKFGPLGASRYLEQVTQVRTTLGLGALGTVAISWDPAHETVTVHKLRLVRDGARIDLLSRQSFTVLRREKALELIVDGRLSATLQPEDLRVGDIVELAYTIDTADALMQGRADLVVPIPTAEVVSVRALWPMNGVVAWRAGDGVPKATLRRRGGMTELTIRAQNLQQLRGPAGAPLRYWPSRHLEFSGFRSWSEVSGLVAPLFDKASELSPDSPLKAEAAKIRALSPDPKVRAAAALKLVQEQVRYLALLMPDGGYTPVDADKTWVRRFGDCKAKTALLVALLHELGIKAEAALVNAYAGDGLDGRLPRLTAFNHVIVRAEIGGRSYWLDGARMNNGPLDGLDTPPHHFALPVSAEGAQLVPLTQTPRETPNAELVLEVDGTGGIYAPVPVHGEMLIRGSIGGLNSVLLTNTSAADREKLLKRLWSIQAWIDVAKVEIGPDALGGSRLLMDGKARIPWIASPDGSPWFIIREGNLGAPTAFKREPGPHDDAPFSVESYPDYTSFKLTMKLPNAGAGFSIKGADVNETVAGRAYRRTSKIDGGMAVIEAATRSLGPEFPASEAAAAAAKLSEMSKVVVAIQAPKGYQPTDADIAALLEAKPKTASDFIGRGSLLAAVHRWSLAIADFDQALALAPESADALASRGLARLEAGRIDLARPDIEHASRLNDRLASVQLGLGAIAMSEGRYDNAVAAYSRAVDLSTDSPIIALGMRASAYSAMGQTEKAIADLDEIVMREPSFPGAYLQKANVFALAGDVVRALEITDAAIKANPASAELHSMRGALLARLGRQPESMAAFADSLALKSTPGGYLTRAKYRDKADLAGKFADFAAAEKLDPASDAPRIMRAGLLVENRDYAAAVATLATPKASTASPDVLAARAAAYWKWGRADQAIRDFAAIRASASDSAGLLNLLCWTEATIGATLPTALTDCEAALKLAPNSAAILDSNGFVLLRLKRFTESVARYDAALKLRPTQAASLYGRGLAKLGAGRTAEGAEDLAAARNADKSIESEFAAYGLAP